MKTPQTITRLLSLLLILAVILPLAACGKTEEPAQDPAGSAGTTDVSPAEESEEQTPAVISDDLPEKDFGGKSFRVLVETGKKQELFVDEYNGNVENDVLFDRNAAVMERFNCKVEVLESGDPIAESVNVVSSGTKDFEMTGMVNFMSGKAISSDVFQNAKDFKYINLEKPWYVGFINDSATINNKIFAVAGDFATTTLTYTFTIFCNLSLYQQYGYTADSLYDTVKKGNWTFDTMASQVKDMYVDKNGNGEQDNEDQFGLGCSAEDGMDIWLAAAGQPVTGRDENGFVTLDMMSERTISIVEKLNNMFHAEKGALKVYGWEEKTLFANNLLVFAPLVFDDCFKTLRNLESDYYVLPLPKFDDAQERYYNTLTDEFSVFAFVKTVPADDYDFAGIVYEALNSESYKTVYPAYYDVALKGKYATDSKTAEMMDMIIEGRSFDIGFTFGASLLNMMPYQLRYLVRDNTTDIASIYAAKQDAVEQGLKDLNDLYR